jgi:hypothetical protein
VGRGRSKDKIIVDDVNLHSSIFRQRLGTMGTIEFSRTV